VAPTPYEIPVTGMPERVLNAERQSKIDEAIVALPEVCPVRPREIHEMFRRLPVKVTVGSTWPLLET
jgi:hypothetical protein